MALTKLNNQSINEITASGIPTLVSANMPTGSVVQTSKHDFYTKTALNTSTATTIVTGNALTLSSTASKVLISVYLSMGGFNGGTVKLQYTTNGGTNWNNITTTDMNSTDNGSGMAGVSHLGTHLNLSENSGNYLSIQTSFAELVSPSATSFNWRLQASGSSSNYQLSFNRRNYDADWGGLSHIVIQEIAG